MNQVERLRDELIARFPSLAAEVDAPGRPGGSWWLDLRYPAGPGFLVIEWRPGRGFGLSTPGPDGDDFGTGPDEVYAAYDEAFARAVELVESGARTEPPLTVQLAELRHRLGMTQAELAERAGVKQANISRIERRGEVMLGTLRKLIRAMGGTLSIRATFPDGQEHEVAV